MDPDERPEDRSKSSDRPYYTFTPASAGVYRFAMIVAANQTISEPDEVEVVVGEVPGDAGGVGSRDLAIPSSLGHFDRPSDAAHGLDLGPVGRGLVGRRPGLDRRPG